MDIRVLEVQLVFSKYTVDESLFVKIMDSDISIYSLFLGFGKGALFM